MVESGLLHHREQVVRGFLAHQCCRDSPRTFHVFVQLTLEQHSRQVGVLTPCAVEDPGITFDSPKTSLLIAYC